jgi:hypothetical protein
LKVNRHFEETYCHYLQGQRKRLARNQQKQVASRALHWLTFNGLYSITSQKAVFFITTTTTPPSPHVITTNIAAAATTTTIITLSTGLQK